MSWIKTPGSLTLLLVGLLACSLALAPVAFAEEPADDATTVKASTEPSDAEATDEESEAAPEYALLGDVDVLWTCIAAFLVFFMQAGFALVESGFTRAKNACNIIMKNVMDISIGSILFWLVGFGIMFGASTQLFGTTNFLFEATSAQGWAFIIFQTMFCATAATIVSGAMAERTKFIGYLVYTVAISVIVYPVFGSWAWGGLWDGGGWLESGGWLATALGNPELYFNDFAGSTVVHSIGGWAALAGAIVIGPRLGKYGKNGKVNAIPGHNIPLAALGVFILWLGWFGFNAGSTTAVGGGEFAKIAFVTTLAAAAGAVGAMIISWVMFKKPDTSFALNGALAGLVSITAGCYDLSATFAIITGFIGGLIVVLSVVAFDKMKIDDPVGAVSVHGVCGAWGTLAVGLFMPGTGLLMGGGATQLIIQAVGVIAAFIWAFPVSIGIFLAIKYTVGLRVSEAEELEGLDIGEHGMHAYPPSFVADGVTGFGTSAPAAKPAGYAMPTPKPSTEGA